MSDGTGTVDSQNMPHYIDRKPPIWPYAIDFWVVSVGKAQIKESFCTVDYVRRDLKTGLNEAVTQYIRYYEDATRFQRALAARKAAQNLWPVRNKQFYG